MHDCLLSPSPRSSRSCSIVNRTPGWVNVHLCVLVAVLIVFLTFLFVDFQYIAMKIEIRNSILASC